jgi:hypothetical protein
LRNGRSRPVTVAGLVFRLEWIVTPAGRRVARLRHEEIASAGHGLDQVSVSPERLAQTGDLKAKVGLFHDRGGPDPAHQLEPFDDGPAGAKQDIQEVEGSTAKLDRLTVFREKPRPEPQTIIPKAEVRDRLGWRGGCSRFRRTQRLGAGKP